MKTNTNVVEVKKAMLECGYPTPFGIDSKWSNAEVAVVSRCMEKIGFSYENGFRFCDLSFADSADACQPNAVILKPSKEKRLNSNYCKGYAKDYAECQP